MEIKSITAPFLGPVQNEPVQEKQAKKYLKTVDTLSDALGSDPYGLDLKVDLMFAPARPFAGTNTENSTCSGCVQTDSGCFQTQNGCYQTQNC